MQGRCDRHPFELAADICGRCGLEFCSECVVYSFGEKKPPFCIPCAVAAAGVRNNAATSAARPALTRREAKRLERTRARALRDHGTVFPGRGEVKPKALVELDLGWAAGLDD